jgi:capsular exopolysaccharide synthesis family protein
VQFLALGRSIRILQVTSPAAAEGKTTTISNLAIALARAGMRVVVVDCDLRRPRLHGFFSLPNEQGFTSVLLGEAILAQAITPVPGEGNVMLVTSGPRPPNPSELLSSRRTLDVFNALKSEADLVIIDCPPVLPVTDAALLSSRVDATLMVVNAGVSTKRQLHSAVETLRRVNAAIIGTVLNGVSADSPYGYEYQYQYQYRPRDEAPEPPSRSRVARRRQRSTEAPVSRV